MKKYIISFIMVLFLLSTSIYAYNINDMDIKIPEEYYDLKTAIDSNDSKIEYYEVLLETTKEEMKNQIETGNILYWGKNTNLSKTLMINEYETLKTKSIYHLHLANEKQVNDCLEMLKNNVQEQSMKIGETEICEINGFRWIKIAFNSEMEKIEQYYTIVNGKGITISLQNVYSNVKQDELEEIIETVQFKNINEKPLEIQTIILLVVTAVLIIIVLGLMIKVFLKKRKNKKDKDTKEE